MEIEYFVNPHDTVEGRPADEYWHDRWIADCMAWFRRYGLREENLRLREHEKDELAHYAKRTVDIEYRFPIGWSELMGIANRTDYDLKQHAKFSGKSLTYFDEERKEHVVPFVVEPAAGVDRALLAFLADAYQEEEVRGEKRVVLRFHPELAPVKVAVLPLLKKREEIVRTAPRHPRRAVAKRWRVVYDDTAAIGRLYRRQDEVGTPYCVTVDVQTVGDSRQGRDRRRPRDHPRPRQHAADAGAHGRAVRASSRTCSRAGTGAPSPRASAGPTAGGGRRLSGAPLGVLRRLPWGGGAPPHAGTAAGSAGRPHARGEAGGTADLRRLGAHHEGHEGGPRALARGPDPPGRARRAPGSGSPPRAWPASADAMKVVQMGTATREPVSSFPRLRGRS